MSAHTAVITGASRGIGRALALHYAARGYGVIGTGRDEQALEETGRTVAAAGGSFSGIAMDLRAPESIEQAAESIAGLTTAVDLLIHNAADVTSKPFRATSPEEIDALVRTNVAGPLQLTLHLLDLLERAESPAIVFISSLAGYKPNPKQTVYSVTKRAVNGMADALRAELKPAGIHVLNVPLSSVVVDGVPKPGEYTADFLANRLDRAVAKRLNDLFLSTRTRWLMRVYGMWPRLMDLR